MTTNLSNQSTTTTPTSSLNDANAARNHAANHSTSETTQYLTETAALPQAYQGAILSAILKSTPEDFVVNECMDIKFTDEGEHLWLLIKKTGMNTAYVAKLLAKWVDIPLRDVGFSGQKDRHAVTTQWFSLRLPTKQLPSNSFTTFVAQEQLLSNSKTQYKKESSNSANLNDADTLNNESLAILDQHWHSKKLNRGTHKSNEFIITLRQVTGDKQDIEDLIERISTQGVPNYFGEQRFGKQGNNLAMALEWLQTDTLRGRRLHPKRNREQISMLISTSRSVIFNQILGQRVRDQTWNKGIDGDVFNLAGSGSIFASTQIDETLRSRTQSADIHPTGALWGIHNDKIQGKAKALELEVIEHEPILQTIAAGLEAKKIKSARRALRMMVCSLNGTWQDNTTLTLKFELPTGCYATSVVNALMHSA